jgi:hypothetical protein
MLWCDDLQPPRARFILACTSDRRLSVAISRDENERVTARLRPCPDLPDDAARLGSELRDTGGNRGSATLSLAGSGRPTSEASRLRWRAAGRMRLRIDRVAGRGTPRAAIWRDQFSCVSSKPPWVVSRYRFDACRTSRSCSFGSLTIFLACRGSTRTLPRWKR